MRDLVFLGTNGAVLLVVLVAAILGIWKLVRCVHPWELVDKTELPSAFEEMSKAGVTNTSIWPSDVPRLAERKVILALRCPKCGAAKIWKSYN